MAACAGRCSNANAARLRCCWRSAQLILLAALAARCAAAAAAAQEGTRMLEACTPGRGFECAAGSFPEARQPGGRHLQAEDRSRRPDGQWAARDAGGAGAGTGGAGGGESKAGAGSGARRRSARRSRVAAMDATIVVRRPGAFDARVQAALARGLRSQAGAPPAEGWVHAAAHAPAPPLASRRRMMGGDAPGVAYTFTIMYKGASRRAAEKARDAVVRAINGRGACALRVDGGVIDLCEYAAGVAELDPFDPAASLLIESSDASAAALPTAAPPPAPPACGGAGAACNGVASECCNWALQECDLRPGSPARGTCQPLAGVSGPTCAAAGGACGADWDCCAFLTCAEGAEVEWEGAAEDGEEGQPRPEREQDRAPGGKRCTWAPARGVLALNVTVEVPRQYDPAVQEGLLSAARRWLALAGGGAAAGRVLRYEPGEIPRSQDEWDAAGRTYRFEVVVSAPTRPALEQSLAAARAALGARPLLDAGGSGGAAEGGGGGGGGGFCGVRAAASGESLCHLAEAHCFVVRERIEEESEMEDPRPCAVRVKKASAETSLSPADGPQPPAAAACSLPGEPCGGPFGFGGECCGDAHMCVQGAPAGGSRLLTGVCMPKCLPEWEPCDSDAECCQYWGPRVCNPELSMCLPPDFKFSWEDNRRGRRLARRRA
ncbi:MAG: hypothetical protein J3K34DRAFT_462666 [Monoraphidium minutum]|nr:MAG: hypothetical protein J3K34DRAFT_462666 [Monoraphidium minutum]